MTLLFKYDHVGISLRAQDLEAAVRWYTSKLDFVVERRFESHGIPFAFLINGDLTIELVGAAPSADDSRFDTIIDSHTLERLHHIGVVVDDVDATLAVLRERDVQPIGEPIDVASTGHRIAFISDIGGNIIELVESGT